VSAQLISKLTVIFEDLIGIRREFYDFLESEKIWEIISLGSRQDEMMKFHAWSF
jgi:hypothetical protein